MARGELDALVADLDGQFAGGNAGSGPAALGVLRSRFEAFEDRDAEGGGFARARLRLAHQIDALEGLGNQSGLDGRRIEILGLVQRGEHDLREPHAGETGAFAAGVDSGAAGRFGCACGDGVLFGSSR